jgi:hypothetical protein
MVPVDPAPEMRVVYPLKAIAAVAAAWLLFLIQVLIGAFSVMLAVPLVPFFVGMLICGSGLVGAAHRYALSVARELPTASKLGAPLHETARQDTLAARTA